MIARLFSRFRQPAHIGQFGDLAEPFATCWTPTNFEIR